MVGTGQFAEEIVGEVGEDVAVEVATLSRDKLVRLDRCSTCP